MILTEKMLRNIIKMTLLEAEQKSDKKRYALNKGGYDWMKSGGKYYNIRDKDNPEVTEKNPVLWTPNKPGYDVVVKYFNDAPKASSSDETMSKNDLSNLENNADFKKKMKKIEKNIGEHPENRTIGNAFRSWVNFKYKAYAKKQNLGSSGSHTNSYIKKAWARYGEEFVKRINSDDLTLLDKKKSVSKEDILNMVAQTEEFKDVSIEIMPGLSENIAPAIINALPQLTKGEEVKLGKGTSKLTPSGEVLKWCAEWVNGQTKRRGAAWHNWHNANQNNFLKISQEDREKLGMLFTVMNSNYKKHQKPTTSGTIPATLKNIAQKHIFKPAELLKIPLGSFVGMYHGRTSFFPVAFWENATGHAWDGSSMGTMIAGGQNKFVDANTGKPWKIEDLNNKNKTFKLSDKYKGIVFNSHIGIVGAKIDGRLIVFHNIDGNIHMTPIKQLVKGGSGDAVMWYQSPDQAKKARPNKAHRWVMKYAKKFDIENAPVSASAAKFASDAYNDYRSV